MTEKYTDRIKLYCDTAEIDIPAGFYNHSANRYVAINLDVFPPKLIAKTWFKQEDVIYYLNNLALGKSMKILDFQERQELLLDGSQKLKRGESF